MELVTSCCCRCNASKVKVYSFKQDNNYFNLCESCMVLVLQFYIQHGSVRTFESVLEDMKRYE